MKMKTNRILAAVLTLALLLTCCPALPVSATEAPQTLTIVNPEYAHLISADDIAGSDLTIHNRLDYGSNYLPEEEAAAVVREAMKKRETTIAVDFYTDETDPEAAPFAAMHSAMVHTGNPTEGDYLHKHYKKCSVSYYSSTGTVDGVAVMKIRATYTVTYMSNAAQEAEMDTAVAALLAELDLKCADDYTKFITVYDYICDNVTYDYDNLGNSEYLLKHAAYAALVQKKAVCQGYALLLYRLMLELGVDCRYIPGVAFNGVESGAHGWNIVKLDGKYYNVDSTWDAGNSNYMWCLQSQATFRDHTRDAEYDTAAFHSAYPMSTADYVYSGDGSPVHSYTPVVTLPTCTAKGYTTYTCKGCNDSYIENYTAAAGHNYVDGVCTVCEDVQPVASGTCGENLTWTLDADGTLTVSGTGRMYDYDFIPPWATYGSSIKTAVIENGVTSIGSWAFGRCENLTSVSVPASVTYIDCQAFNSSSSLTGIWVDANNANYCSDSNGVLFNKNKTTLVRLPVAWSGSYTIPDTVTIINDAAFGNCAGLTAVTIPDGVTAIRYAAFGGCTNLTSVVIPASVTSIGNFAFSSVKTAVILGKDTEISYDAFFSSTALEGHSGSTAQAYASQYGNSFKALTRITGASLVLQSNLAINYKVNKVLFEEYGFANPYLVVEMGGVKTTICDYYVDGDKYVFAFRNIAPNKMNDTVSATLYATYKGTEYTSAARDYSVATYAYNTLGKNIDAELKTLLVDLLHYGAASQVYTAYRTDALVNANLTETQLAWGTSQTPTLENVLNTKYQTVANPTAKWKGAGLYLQDAVAIRLTLEAESIDGLSVKITNDNDQTWTIPSSEFQPIGDNKYYVYFTGLDAGQMRQNVYLTICNGDTPVSNTARYSICSYAESKQNDANVALVNLLQAMMKYGDSAYAYAN